MKTSKFWSTHLGGVRDEDWSWLKTDHGDEHQAMIKTYMTIWDRSPKREEYNMLMMI